MIAQFDTFLCSDRSHAMSSFACCLASCALPSPAVRPMSIGVLPYLAASLNLLLLPCACCSQFVCPCLCCLLSSRRLCNSRRPSSESSLHVQLLDFRPHSLCTARCPGITHDDSAPRDMLKGHLSRSRQTHGCCSFAAA